MNKIFFIVNPQAKNGFGMKIWKIVENELLKKQVSYEVYLTEYQGHAKDIANRIGCENQREDAMIVAIGGDGTIHEVINGIIKYSNFKVGFIPGGSGNDFCRGFSIPFNPIESLEMILDNRKNHAEMIDIGKLENKQHEEVYFVNNMGAGFDAQVAEDANHSRLKSLFNRFSLGKLVYAVSLIKKLITFKCTSVELIIDGSIYKFQKVWFITVSNQPFFGGGMKISPNADYSDGELNITVVDHLSKIKLLLVFISVFWGGHTKFKEVKMYKGQKIKINSSPPLLVHCDGEIKGYTPVSVNVVNKGVSIVKDYSM